MSAPGAGAVLGLAIWLWPRGTVRWLLRWLVRILYGVRVEGAENLPVAGAAVVVCQRFSGAAAFCLAAAGGRRVRMVVGALGSPGVCARAVLRAAGAIWVSGAEGPRGTYRVIRAVSDALGAGEAVCVFVEGAEARGGAALPLDRWLERVGQRCRAPVVPVVVDRGGPWRRLGGRVTVRFGRALAAVASAYEVRQALAGLAADCAAARSRESLPLHRRLVRVAARRPFRACVIDSTNRGKTWKYAEVVAGSWIFSQLLRRLLGEEKMVGVWLPPSAGGVFTNVALALLHKVPVNLNYTAGPESVRSAVRQCGIRHVLTSRLFTARVPLEPGPGVELVYLEDFRKHVSRGRRLVAWLAVVALPGFVLERWLYRLGGHGPDDLATVIFSSGTTGEPKGVMLAQRNLVANVESIVEAIEPGPRDRILGILPFFHSFGFTVTLWTPLQVGASAVYHADPRQAPEIGELCRTFRCTVLLTTPTFLRFMLRRCEPGDFDSLRILMCGAEKLPLELATEFERRFQIRPLEGYGCTELSPVVAANIGADERTGVSRPAGNKPGTIGRPVPGVTVRVVEPETWRELGPGEDGMLLAYGGNVMVGYLGRPDATREVVRDGWYVTGDVARVDADGFVTITDRLSRFSKIGGEMVPHQKVEDELHAVLGTTERACVVTAVPDPKRGERLVVLHLPFSGTDAHQVWRRLGERGLPNLWVPAERDFFVVAEVPVLGSGKVDLRRAREIALERSRAAG